MTAFDDVRQNLGCNYISDIRFDLRSVKRGKSILFLSSQYRGTQEVLLIVFLMSVSRKRWESVFTLKSRISIL